MVRPKIQVRTVMILVMIVALGLWGEQMRRRRAYCLQKSLEHRSKLYMSSYHMTHKLLPAEKEEELRKSYPHAAWHLELSDAYLRYASRPWLSVPPEPPEP